MGIPDHLSCLLRNLCAGQEATDRIGHVTTDWFQIGKRVHQGCILSPCLFNFCAELGHAKRWTSKAMFKILQDRLQQYVNHELPDVQAGFRKGRGTTDEIANIHWIIEK